MIYEGTTPQLQRGQHPTPTPAGFGTMAKTSRAHAFLTTKLAAYLLLHSFDRTAEGI